MKSIRIRIVATSIAITAFFLILLGSLSCVLHYNGTVGVLSDTLSETAIVTSERIQWELKSYENIANEIGAIKELSDPKVKVEEKQEIINQRVKSYGFERGNILTSDGDSIFDENNYSDREYFKHSINGETFVSDPVVSKITGEITVIISAPLWENGVIGGNVSGVVYVVPHETFLNDIMSTIKIGESASAYMINKNGTTIADVTVDSVKNQRNIEFEAMDNDSLKELADIHSKAKAGEVGFGSYSVQGVNRFTAYSPISETDGWSVLITVPQGEFMRDTNNSIIIMIVILIIALAVSIVGLSIMSRRVANPIKQCALRLQLLAEGDIHTEVEEVKSKDETHKLAEATSDIVSFINDIIADVSLCVESIIKGDLTKKLSVNFPGDFEKLKLDLEKLISELSNTMGQIRDAAAQVSDGSAQVSSGAQTLSQGTTEQASSIQEMSATLNEITDRIKVSAENLTKANMLVAENSEVINTCDEHMQSMINAMKEITNVSNEIRAIIGTIDDIAFQTNILALNAAVEAAHAGEAGRGFSVVAEEVRNLAQKSQEAASNTTELIQKSIIAIENGAEIAEDTAQSLNQVVANSETIGNMIDVIASNSNEEANAAVQITVGVEQISGVVQSNAATAEESAATSEELSAQAEMLKRLIHKFKLK